MLIGPEQKAPLTSESMLVFTRSFLSAKDYMGLLKSTLEGNEAPGICGAYSRWERSLRNDLVTLRARKQNVDAGKYYRESEPVYGTEQIAIESIMIDSPLEAELYLNRHRWLKIDELAAGHMFDIEFIRSYRMKILILERHSRFTEELGFKAYRHFYNQVISASGIELQGFKP